jgi:hypothetical protein
MHLLWTSGTAQAQYVKASHFGHVMTCCVAQNKTMFWWELVKIHTWSCTAEPIEHVYVLEMVSNGLLGAEICAKGKVEMFYSNLVTGPTVPIWENARCSATGGPMKIPRPGSSRTRSVAQFMYLKQCYLRKLHGWYVLPQLGQKCFLNYSNSWLAHG